VYDPSTYRLIIPSTQKSLLIFDPGNGLVVGSISLPAPVEALGIDPATNQLFASTVSSDYVSGLSVFNARTYALEKTMTFPSCIDNDGASSNAIHQILIDPSHGDAYLVGTLSLFTLNLSTLSLVGTAVDYGDGDQLSAAYVPTTDQIFYTYLPLGMTSPGLSVQLHHGRIDVLTSVLWLPGTVGAIAAAQVVAAGIAIAWVQFRERARRRGQSTPS
jgi:hypothetical protein